MYVSWPGIQAYLRIRAQILMTFSRMRRALSHVAASHQALVSSFEGGWRREGYVFGTVPQAYRKYF